MKYLRLLLAALLALAALLMAAPSQAETGSEVTVPGTGAFSALKITVSQTTDLINQTVRVTWTGGQPTGPSGNFATNYLQIMQCWGDAPTGPTREQCQYGGLAARGSPVAGAWTRLRQVSYGTLVDQKETLKPEAGKQAVVPFTSVSGVTTTSTGEFFTAGTTNEVPLAKTRLDGGGEVDFEVQTALEADGLGCGTVVNGVPRACWLVIVPRGNTEVDGTQVGVGDNRPQLDSSPLSETNWENHISVPLKFQPVGDSCPLGSAERQTSGDEFLSEAVLRWQPTLCAGGGTVYGFTQVPDGVARQTVVSDNPGLAFMTDPVPQDQVTKPLVYAPIALSGLSIAFITERQSAGEGVVPPEVWQRDGEQITEMNLNPRLVAKLLTQSYVLSLPVRQDYLKGNPDSLTLDPEFLKLNPDFEDSGRLMSAVDALVPTVDMDATTMLWNWIKADKDASDFVNGVPDPYGMKVNPSFRGTNLPVSNFPRSDLTCAGTGNLASCALDLRPLANDMHEAGRAISRGDTLGKAPTGFSTPTGAPELKAVDREPQGQRSLLAVVDTPTAERYGLPTAKLRNSSGAFVAPTDTAMLAAVAAAKPGATKDVLHLDPTTTAADAYPPTPPRHRPLWTNRRAPTTPRSSSTRWATASGRASNRAPCPPGTCRCPIRCVRRPWPPRTSSRPSPARPRPRPPTTRPARARAAGSAEVSSPRPSPGPVARATRVARPAPAPDLRRPFPAGRPWRSRHRRLPRPIRRTWRRRGRPRARPSASCATCW
ncbi:hypothetical protein [Amycolatopsis sp. DSM 110486]|uniref:hypothetical protein n=1 Tax=Amycolatopsis sp. DSM 110486 TaxID=2865832 RepID=UPI0021025F43|nr:hypothetical protein [Amycolatopsis sp. DSM 110486]